MFDAQLPGGSETQSSGRIVDNPEGIFHSYLIAKFGMLKTDAIP